MKTNDQYGMRVEWPYDYYIIFLLVELMSWIRITCYAKQYCGIWGPTYRLMYVSGSSIWYLMAGDVTCHISLYFMIAAGECVSFYYAVTSSRSASSGNICNQYKYA